MKKLISFALILCGLYVHCQEIVTDWKELDGQLSLKKYVVNQAYNYFNFKPSEKDTINTYAKAISQNSSNSNVIIRDKSSVPDKPLVIINNYPTDNETILTKIKLSDIEQITLYEPTETTFAIYGYRSRYGVILIDMSQKKWRKMKRKYGR